MTKQYPRILTEFEKRRAGLHGSMLHNAPEAILEALCATLSKDEIVGALERSRFNRPDEYVSTIRVLQEIAQERHRENAGNPQ